MWKLKLFGGVSLQRETTSISNFGTARAAKLLVLLALSRSGKMNREQLAWQLWPDDPYEASRLRLRQEIHRLKKALGDASDLVGSNATEVWVNTAEIESDLHQLAAAHSEPEVEVAPDMLVEPFLPGWDDPWVFAERAQAEQLQIHALDLSQRLVSAHPLHEELRLVAVTAHANLGNMAMAVAEYQDLRRKMKDQLGIEPTLSTEDVLRTALDQRPATKAPRLDWSQTVPIPSDPIFGRDDVVSQLESMLSDSTSQRLLTLIGPGGVGKTRVAIEVASRLSTSSTCRVAYLPTPEAGSPEDWARSAMSLLGIDIPSASDPVHFLASVLSEEPTILVLDNLETALESVRTALVALLKSTPTLRVLATSTRRVEVDFELAITIGPIDAKTAGCEWLAHALRTARPLAARAQDVEKSLQQIAIQLDGFPLSIRLAAARFRLLSPQELLKQLEFALKSGGQELPERHRSLDSALATSLSSVPPDLIDTLEHVSAYPGGMGMDIARTALGELDYLDRLESLLDAGLLVMDDQAGPTRVRVLSPVRNYVLGRLTEETITELELGVVDNIVELVASRTAVSGRPFKRSDLDILDAESDNVRFVWQQILRAPAPEHWEVVPKFALYEAARGRASSSYQALDAKRILWQDASPEMKAELELTLAQLAVVSQKEDLALPPALRALEIGQKLESNTIIGRALLFKADQAFRRNFRAAEEDAREALRLAELTDGGYIAARAHARLGAIFDFLADIKQAVRHLRKAYDGFIACESEDESIRNGIYLAGVMTRTPRVDEAMEIMSHTRQMLLSCRNPLIQAFHKEIEAKVLYFGGSPEQAEPLFRETLHLWQAMGSEFQEADQSHSLAMTLITLEKWGEARRHLYNAGQKWFADRNPGGLCSSLSQLVKVMIHEGDEVVAQKILGFIRAFREAHDLVLVEQELGLQSKLAEEIGENPDHGTPLTLEGARDWFDLLQ
jgi:predicted ATPase/DNA-binding SARP family transcriptional activator